MPEQSILSYMYFSSMSSQEAFVQWLEYKGGNFGGKNSQDNWMARFRKRRLELLNHYLDMIYHPKSFYTKTAFFQINLSQPRIGNFDPEYYFNTQMFTGTITKWLNITWLDDEERCVAMHVFS